MRQVAPQRPLRKRLMFSKSVMVSVGVSKLGLTDLIFIDAGVKINGTVRCFWLKSYHLSCVRSVASSLSSSKTISLLTERTRQSTFWNEGHHVYFPKSLVIQQLTYEPSWLQNLGNAASPYQTKMVDRCLAWFWAKRHRWRNWSVTQTSPCIMFVCLCLSVCLWCSNVLKVWA